MDKEQFQKTCNLCCLYTERMFHAQINFLWPEKPIRVQELSGCSSRENRVQRQSAPGDENLVQL